MKARTTNILLESCIKLAQVKGPTSPLPSPFFMEFHKKEDVTPHEKGRPFSLRERSNEREAPGQTAFVLACIAF